jgi:hypothetical protein
MGGQARFVLARSALSVDGCVIRVSELPDPCCFVSIRGSSLFGAFILRQRDISLGLIFNENYYIINPM